MAINYEKVGWDTTKFVGPTNMNHMDTGIKKACDGVDALNTAMGDADISKVGDGTAKGAILELNNNLNVIGTVISGTDDITITKGTWNITANAKANDNNGSICGIVSDIGSSTSNSVPGYGFSAGVSISGIITTDSSKTIYFNTYSGDTSISEKNIKAVRIA